MTLYIPFIAVATWVAIAFPAAIAVAFALTGRIKEKQ